MSVPPALAGGSRGSSPIVREGVHHASSVKCNSQGQRPWTPDLKRRYSFRAFGAVISAASSGLD